MELILLLSAVVILLCVLFNRLTSKIGIPMLLAFIGLGMIFGSDGPVSIVFDDYRFSADICSVALIFIMFYGGFGTKWSAAKPVAAKSLLLSSAGVIFTAGLTGVFCHLVLRVGWLESFLMGSVIGSTDAASVFSILRSKRLGLKENTASLLEVESGSNDPASYMLTSIFLSLMQESPEPTELIHMIFAQVVYGVAVGVVLAMLTQFVLKNFRFSTAGFDAVFMVAVAILSYVLPTLIGGNGYLSTYIVGIILGNTDFKGKRSMVHFFDGITGLMQVLIFFLLGLVSTPSRLPAVALPAVLIALFLTFVARPAAVFALLTPFRCSIRQQLLVSFAGLRGAASIVFAILVEVSGVDMSNDIFHVVFLVVLLSIGLQGSLLPFVARKLRMTDSASDAMKTFTDYSEEQDLQFIELHLRGNHPWCGKALREIKLLPDTLVVLIMRRGVDITPRGSTVLLENDDIVLAAPSYTGGDSVRLNEIHVTDNSHLVNQKIADCFRQKDELVVLIQRGGRNVIPKGETVILAGDTLIIHSCRER